VLLQSEYFGRSVPVQTHRLMTAGAKVPSVTFISNATSALTYLDICHNVINGIAAHSAACKQADVMCAYSQTATANIVLSR
jgi:hypothetical protein